MHIINLSASKIPSTSANSVQVAKMSQALTDLGNFVTLICRETSLDEDPKKYYNINKSEKLNFIYQWWPEIRGFGGAAYGLQSMKNLKKIKLPDILYGRDLYSLFFLRNKGYPTYYESHMIPRNKFKYFLEQKLINSKTFKKLIVTANSLKQAYLDLFSINNDDILVLRNGADDRGLRLKDVKNSVQDYNFNIGYVGSLKSGKGIVIAIELAHKLRDHEFHIVGGSTEDIVKLKEFMLNKFGENLSNVTFYGYKKQKELKRIYPTLDIMLAPYKRQYYNFRNVKVPRYPSPLKLIEYMSFGKIIMASDLEMCREVIDDGENGFLCKPNSLNDWKNKITKVSVNKNLRVKIASNVLEKFNTSYTWEQRANKFIDTFK